MPLPEPGSILNERYELYRVLGAGGFGVVFAATDLETGEPTAVKMMLAHLVASDTPTRRFEREVAIASRLQHPNIVRLLDFGVTEDDALYYAMELLDGTDLAAHLAERGPLRPVAAVHVFEQVLSALAEAHEMGVIHRDLKPANIFVCPTDEDRWFTKVLDFGIAKSIDASDRESITMAGKILGTPQYMAPETVRSAVYEPASDVYAVGLSLFEALTGRPAFEGHPHKVLLSQMNVQVELPEELRGTPLGDFLDRCLQKDPRDRFWTAGEAFRRLREIRDSVEHLPTLAAPVVIARASEYEGHQVALSLEDRQRLAEAAASGAQTEPPSNLRLQTFAAIDDRQWDELRGDRVENEKTTNRLLVAGLVAVLIGCGLLAVRVSSRMNTNLGSVEFGKEVYEDFVIRIESRPPGATLRVDGTVLGTTPRVVTIEGPSLPVEIAVGEGESARAHTLTKPTKKLVLRLPEGAKLVGEPDEVQLNVDSEDDFDLDDIDYDRPAPIDPLNADALLERLSRQSSPRASSSTNIEVGRECGKWVKGESEKVEVAVGSAQNGPPPVHVELVKPRTGSLPLRECIEKRFRATRPRKGFRTTVIVRKGQYVAHEEQKKKYRETREQKGKSGGPVIEYAK